MSFNTALSGLNAASAELGVVSNNVANSSTVGLRDHALSLLMSMQHPLWVVAQPLSVVVCY